ncbi:hypothetical protein LTR95_017491 [Oleoguttula sp. CCFEE 5521]
MAMDTRPSTSRASLLGLPVELRLEILKYYFDISIPSWPHWLVPRQVTGKINFSFTRYLEGVAVLQACHQLRAEGGHEFEKSLDRELQRTWQGIIGEAELTTKFRSANLCDASLQHLTVQEAKRWWTVMGNAELRLYVTDAGRNGLGNPAAEFKAKVNVQGVLEFLRLD